MKSKYIPIALTLICLFWMPPLAESKICYVSKSGIPDGPGDSWSTAFDDFATAIKSMQPEDSLFIAEGIYYLPSESVIVKYGIRLFGGFAGWESHPDERIPGLNETIIMPFINYSRIVLDSIYIPSHFDQITFKGGYLYNGPHEWCDYPYKDCTGAAILIDKSNGTKERIIEFRYCIFISNVAYFGGALSLYNENESDSKFHFFKCYFESNLAMEGPGGAMFVVNRSGSHLVFTIDSCFFIENISAEDGSVLYYGRQASYSDSIEITNSYFNKNKIAYGGGGVLCIRNHLIAPMDDVNIRKCVFKNNFGKSPTYQGGVASGSALKLVNCGNVDQCVFDGNVGYNTCLLTGYNMSFTNSLFVNNISSSFSTILNSGSSTELGFNVFRNRFINCTFYNNKNDGGVPSPLFYRSYPILQDTIINCVFLNNSNDSITPVFVSKWGANENNRLYANHIGGDVRPESFYVMLDSTGIAEFEPDESTWFPGDPMFVDTAGGDFRLKRCSPMINKGHNAFVTWNTDLSGAVRIQEDTVDLGAYERLRFIPEIDVLPATCAHDPDGAVLLEPGGITPPASWHIYDSMGTMHEQDHLSPGSYMAKLMDGEQCERIFTIDIVGPDTIQVWFSISGTTAGNATGSIRIDSIKGGNPGYTIEWFDGSDGLSVEDLTSGTYTLTITDDGDCARMWEIEVPLINSLDPTYASGQFTYNNPARGVLMYNWKTAIPQDATYHFKDISGNEVLSGCIYTGTGEIPLPTVSTGYYNLILHTESGSVQYPVIVVK